MRSALPIRLAMAGGAILVIISAFLPFAVATIPVGIAFHFVVIYIAAV